MITEFKPEQRVQLRELLQNATLQAAFQYARERCPKAFIPGSDFKLDQVALQSAHRQGYEDCLSVLLGLASDRPIEGESPFMEMNDEPAESHGNSSSK